MKHSPWETSRSYTEILKNTEHMPITSVF